MHDCRTLNKDESSDLVTNMEDKSKLGPLRKARLHRKSTDQEILIDHDDTSPDVDEQATSSLEKSFNDGKQTTQGKGKVEDFPFELEIL